MSNHKGWMFYAMITTILWGVWGALIELPEKAGFPATLGYAVWAITLIPVSIIALKRVGWKLETQKRNVVLALLAGAFGCGGQIILFQVLRIGPAYLVFPLISLYPVVTIFLSVVFLKEKASKRAWAGIILALIAIILLSYQPSENDNNMGYL
jgi:drug/metabolite transporter (DMT)-like permease